MSHESLQGSGSQGSMAMDLHLDCPVTLRVRDKRRNQLRRQRRVDEDERQPNDDSRRNSHSCSPRLPSHYHKEFNIPHSTGKLLIQKVLLLTKFFTFRWFSSSTAHSCVVTFFIR